MHAVYAIAVLLALAITGDAYSTKHDDFDMKAAVGNIDTLKSMAACFLDKGDCDNVAAHFKNDLGDAIQKVCDTCTDAQKKHFNVFLGALKVKIPEDYEAFRKKYDPQGLHFDKLEANVAGF